MAQAPDLLFRSYRPEDEEARELLEERANQFKNPKLRETFLVGGLLQRLQDSVQVYLSYGGRGFDARATVAEDHEIIVADQGGLGLRAARRPGLPAPRNRQPPVGGGGTALFGKWRVPAVPDGQCRDEKARALYKALGYQQASRRWQSAVFLTDREHVPSDYVVVPLSLETAALLTSQYYGKRDLSLSTCEAFAELLNSSDCEGTLLAVRRSDLPDNAQHLDDAELSLSVEAAISTGEISSYGGVSLWNTSATKSVRVVRLFVKKETWLSLPFQAIMLAAVVTPLTIWGANLVGRVTASNSMNTSHWRAGLLLTESLSYCVLTRYAYKAANFFRFIVTRDSRRLQAKAFGAFKHGLRGIECMESALGASRVHIRSRGYGVWVLNADEHHPDREVFPKSGFRTIWMQKWLKPVTSTTDEWPAFSPTVFCDPRNL